MKHRYNEPLYIGLYNEARYNAPINVIPARGGGGGGRAWGGDLIVFVGPGVGHLTDLVLPGEGIFESWRYLTADSDEKDWDRTYVSSFHASRMRRTVWKDLEIVEADENKRKLSGFHCFVFTFHLF